MKQERRTVGKTEGLMLRTISNGEFGKMNPKILEDLLFLEEP